VNPLNVIATVSQLRVATSTLPGGTYSLALSFVTTAGSNPIPINMTFGSTLLGFAPALTPAEGRATASIGTTDSDGNGSTLTYLGLGGTAYVAEVNGIGLAGTDFANLLGGGGQATGPFGSSTTPTTSVLPGVPPSAPVASMPADHFSITRSTRSAAPATSSSVSRRPALSRCSAWERCWLPPPSLNLELCLLRSKRPR
jgi:hypothetical protein